MEIIALIAFFFFYGQKAKAERMVGQDSGRAE